MKALIDPRQRILDKNGSEYFRIAEVREVLFEVALPLFWQDCPNDCVPDVWGKKCDTGVLEVIQPIPPLPEIVVAELP